VHLLQIYSIRCHKVGMTSHHKQIAYLRIRVPFIDIKIRNTDSNDTNDPSYQRFFTTYSSLPFL
jgi:hypothetical protein